MTAIAAAGAPSLAAQVRAVLGQRAAIHKAAADGLTVSAALADLPDVCARLQHGLEAPLTTMIGYDDRPQSGDFRLVYVFAAPAGWVSVEATVDPRSPSFPSVTPRLPAAHWYEREVQDMLGLVPEGHPDPRRLVLHDDWPNGVHPLRKDFDPAVPVPRVYNPPYRFHHLHGEGMVEIPVGPIHAGVIEPGHFRFAAVGEVVLHLETRLFYTHRGIEKLAEGKTAEQVLSLAEHTCGACALSHAVAYCQAIETLAGVSIPPRAAAIRSLLLELERLYNHVGDLGNLCAGVGFAVGASHGAWLKEQLQRLNERVAGNRFLRGICQLGGVRRDIDGATADDIAHTLREVADEFDRFVELVLGTQSVTERFAGTGRLETETARALGAVGVAARASGIRGDLRKDHPYAAYGEMQIPDVVQPEGDVRARARVRIDEVRVAFGLAQQLVTDLPQGPIATSLSPLPPLTTALGCTESPRGSDIHWIRTGADGTIDRYRIRSASYCNWPIVGQAVPGNMVPDFPLINKSFELCYACLDR